MQRITPRLFFVAIMLVAGAAALGIGALRDRADDARQAEIFVARLEGLANRLSALEWQAIATRGLDAELAEDAELTQEAMR